MLHLFVTHELVSPTHIAVRTKRLKGQVETPMYQPVASVPPPRKAARWPKIVGGIVGTLGVIGIVGYAVHKPLATWYIKREATRFGVEINFSDIDVGWSQVMLSNAKVSLTTAPTLRLETDKLWVDHDTFKPTNIRATQARAEMNGPITTTLRALQKTRESTQLPKLKVYVEDLSWVVHDGETRFAEAHGPFLHDESGTHALSLDGSAAIVPLKNVRFDVPSTGPLEIGLGVRDIKATPNAKLWLLADAELTTVKITLPPTTSSQLAQVWGVTPPKKETTVEGEIALKEQQGALTGNVKFILAGYVPPHPREIGALVGGGRTTLSANIRTTKPTQGFTSLAVEDATVGVGSLLFKGKGTIDPDGPAALRMKLALHTSISCATVAQSVVSTNLGPIGDLLGGVAAGMVDGFVNVSLDVDASSQKLDRPQIRTRVGVGCGLKGLSSD